MKLRFRQVVASDGTLQPGDVIETSYKEIYIICQQRKQRQRPSAANDYKEQSADTL